MDKDTLIRESFDYILCIEDAIRNSIQVPYGDNSGYFTKEEQLENLRYCYSMLHKALESSNE